MSDPGPVRRQSWVGYGLVELVSLAIRALGIFPFVIAGYVFMQLALAPLGLAETDPTNNDGLGPQLVAGVLVPLAVVVGWVIAVHGLNRGWRPKPVPAWSLAVLALAAPTIGYVVVQLT